MPEVPGEDEIHHKGEFNEFLNNQFQNPELKGKSFVIASDVNLALVQLPFVP